MLKYYVIACGIELLPIQYALAGTSFAVDQFNAVSSELLTHCLNQDFQFRACDKASTADQLVLFSDRKDAERFIRQMIKVNYCGYFADKNDTPTKAGNMVTAELGKIEAALKTSLGLQNQ